MKKRQVIGVLLLIAAAVLISLPFFKYELLEARSASVSAADLTKETIQENNEEKAVFEMDAIEPPSVLDTVLPAQEAEKLPIVGQITIPSVNLDLPIIKGTTNDHLMAGATTMRENQRMGFGNYPLAGHHMKRDDLLFSPLLRIKTGAEIILTDLTYTYTYTVTKTETVHESRTDVISNTLENRITLVTCYSGSERDKRWIVYGELTETAKYEP